MTATPTPSVITCKLLNQWYCIYPPATTVAGKDALMDTILIVGPILAITIAMLTMYFIGKFAGRSAVIEKLMEVRVGERNNKLMEMARWYKGYSGREEVREYVWRMEGGQQAIRMQRRNGRPR